MPDTEAFFAAIHTGNAAQVGALLDEQPELLGVRSPSGLSPVLFAVYYRKPALADLLISRGASLDVFGAAASGHVDALEALLRDHPGRLTDWSPDGFSLLGLAALFGQTRAARALIARGADVRQVSRHPMHVTPLHSAATGGHEELAADLLDAGADVNAVQSGGITPLMGAAQGGHVAVVRLLLARGADPEARSGDGERAADYARDWSSEELRGLLPL